MEKAFIDVYRNLLTLGYKSLPLLHGLKTLVLSQDNIQLQMSFVHVYNTVKRSSSSHFCHIKRSQSLKRLQQPTPPALQTLQHKMALAAGPGRMKSTRAKRMTGPSSRAVDRVRFLYMHISISYHNLSASPLLKWTVSTPLLLSL